MIKEMKDLYRYYKYLRKTNKEVEMEKIKTGIKTTEFWLALITAIITVLNEQLGLNLPKEAIISIIAMVISYIFGRSIVKKNATK
jgi:uncharacterized oligopeptide transporter (OPT) family protein